MSICYCEKCYRTSCSVRRTDRPVHNCGNYKDTPFTNADKLRETKDNKELANKIYQFCSDLSTSNNFCAVSILNYLNEISD